MSTKIQDYILTTTPETCLRILAQRIYAPPITHTSFVLSLVMKSLPLLSNATSAGRKHLFGQFALLGLLMTLIAAVFDVDGSVGIPVEGLNTILLRR
jgi:hypothetical protein